MLQAFHDSLLGGHVGSLHTYVQVASQFYRKGIRQKNSDYVQKCHICQQAEGINVHPGGLLQPLPTSTDLEGHCYGLHMWIATF